MIGSDDAQISRSGRCHGGERGLCPAATRLLDPVHRSRRRHCAPGDRRPRSGAVPRPPDHCPARRRQDDARASTRRATARERSFSSASTDGGRTWSERLPVPDNWSTSLETPTIHRVVDRKGKKRLILFSGLYPIRMAVSENDGREWTPLKPIGDFGGIVAMAAVERLKDGRLHGAVPRRRPFHLGRCEASEAAGVQACTRRSRATAGLPGARRWSSRSTSRRTCASLAWCVRPMASRSRAAAREQPQVQLLCHLHQRRRRYLDRRRANCPARSPATATSPKYAPDGRLFITFRDTTHESPTKGDWVAWVGRY